MQLFELKIGKAKSNLKTQMIDKLSTVSVYLKSRGAKGMSGKLKDGLWFEVSVAPTNAKKYSKKSTTVGGNKCMVPRINKHGGTTIPGYISKDGFNQHT